MARRKRAGKWRSYPRSLLLVAEASCRLMLARTVLKLDSFARISRRLGTFVAPDDARAATAFVTRRPHDARIARQVRWAIRRTAPLMPFATTCLSEAIAAHAMLRRRGVGAVLHFGMDHRDADRKGHAWLAAAGVEITGYPVDPGLTELGCIV